MNDFPSSPQFTRRHYVWLASAMRDVLNEFSPRTDREAVIYGIKIFAEALASDNPNFDKERFLNNVFCPNLTN